MGDATGSGASTRLAKARSRRAKTLKTVRHSSSSASGQETEVARLIAASANAAARPTRFKSLFRD
jgi:hypothetical protein